MTIAASHFKSYLVWRRRIMKAFSEECSRGVIGKRKGQEGVVRSGRMRRECRGRVIGSEWVGRQLSERVVVGGVGGSWVMEKWRE